MEQSLEEFEPLFDYSRVQPKNLVFLDDEGFDSPPIRVPVKKQKKCGKEEKEDDEREKEGRGAEVVVLDDEDDWLAPPPPKASIVQMVSEEDITIKELRLKKKELASLAQSAEDILKLVSGSVTKDISTSENSDAETAEELPVKKADRKKIILSIQDKDGHKQFRVYTDDSFERLFKMYAEKVKLPVESLVFSFDGDRVSPTVTPEGLGLEDDDMIEVHQKSK